MIGRRFRSKHGAWEIVITGRWRDGWTIKHASSSRTHHVTEHTLRRHYEAIT